MKELYFAIGAFIILIFCVLLEIYKNKHWHKQQMRNFPFYFKGKLFWYSRSVAVTSFTFCKNIQNELCVLANLRGKGTPDFQGFWNAPCGYLDFNETGEMAAQREVLEETGLNIPLNEIKLVETDTNPGLNRQNISLRYVTIMDGVTSDYVLTKKNMEKDEVEEIKWIPISQINDYQWAFNHAEEIQRMHNLFTK